MRCAAAATQRLLHSCSAVASSLAPAAADVLVDCVVVGAGVIGLAVARAAARAGLETVLLESESTWGTGTSSRHSEVIHAGIYYTPGSLKAQLCVEGRAALYDYCAARHVPHARLGKLIVATAEQQVPQLQQLQATAAANGVGDLQLLSGSEARELEPALSAAAALLSPSTGILDSHVYMQALLADAEGAGAVLSTHSRFLGARQGPGQWFVSAPGGGSSGDAAATQHQSSRAPRHVLRCEVQDTGSGAVSSLATRWLVNAAGLGAQHVAATISPAPAPIPRRHLAKGTYFALTGAAAPFTRLVYPLPQEGGLGVHLTLDLAGQAKFGPDVEWVSRVDYSVDASRADAFYAAIRAYYPGLPHGCLAPAYAGVRPKLSGPGEAARDFVLQGPAQHGVGGLINLYGLESPGLTSSLAVAREVLRMLRS